MPSIALFRRGFQRHLVRAAAASVLALGAVSGAQAGPAPVWHAAFQVISVGGVGTFGFHAANIGGLTADFPVTTITSGVAASAGFYDVDTTSVGTLTVTSVPSDFALADGWCSDDNGAAGNRVAGVTLVGNTFTLPANTMAAEGYYTCTVKFNYVSPVPTLGEYGLGALALLLGGGAALGLRRRRAA